MKNVYLVANAHLDPVWLWRWEEGCAEALSTFRTAAELTEEFPGFVFNHNESVLYQWVKENDPALFETIRRQVQEGHTFNLKQCRKAQLVEGSSHLSK